MLTKVRCLWLSGDYPFPARDGAVAYSRGMAEALGRDDVRVTALCLTRDEYEPVTGTAANWLPVGRRRTNEAASVLSPLPNVAHAVATRRYVAAVIRSLRSCSWDVVVIDHIMTGWAVDLVSRFAVGRRPVLVHVSHNHEHSVRLAVARSARVNAAKAAALYVDAEKAGRLERHVVERADIVTTITSDDFDRFASSMPNKQYLVSPPGYDGPRLENRSFSAAQPRRAVVLGSFNWHVKQANLEEFLAVADPAFAAAGAEIVVVGAAPDAFVNRLRPALRATTFTGPVDSITPHLQDARVGIVAEQLGGGFKLKSLDYVFHRVPIVALHGSLTGIPLRPDHDMLSFPDMRGVAEGALAAMDDGELLGRLQASAFQRCQRRFDWSSRGVQLHEAIVAARADRSRPRSVA